MASPVGMHQHLPRPAGFFMMTSSLGSLEGSFMNAARNTPTGSDVMSASNPSGQRATQGESS
eukprot:6843620-Lingulodinium_polyedra.AAC.1